MWEFIGTRRTFFHYFKSKDDILLAYQDGGFADALSFAILAQPPNQTPLDVAQKCILEVSSKYETKESIVADKLLRPTEALRARKEAMFVEMEQLLFEAFQGLWPEQERRDGLRLVSIIVVGTLRFAMEDWRAEKGAHPLAYYIARSFALLKDQF